MYRVLPDGVTESWDPHKSTWSPCLADEPYTRVRGPNEGMVVFQAKDRSEWRALFSIEDLLADSKRRLAAQESTDAPPC